MPIYRFPIDSERSGDLTLGHPCRKQLLNSLRFIHFQPTYHGLTPVEGLKGNPLSE